MPFDSATSLGQKFLDDVARKEKVMPGIIMDGTTAPPLAAILRTADRAQHPPDGMFASRVTDYLDGLAAPGAAAVNGTAPPSAQRQRTNAEVVVSPDGQISSTSGLEPSSEKQRELRSDAARSAEAKPVSVALGELQSTELVRAGRAWRMHWSEKFLGCIDGFENFRVLLLLWKGAGGDQKSLQDLEEAYNRLPVRRSPTNNGVPCQARIKALALPTQVHEKNQVTHDQVGAAGSQVESNPKEGSSGVSQREKMTAGLKGLVGPSLAEVIDFIG